MLFEQFVNIIAGDYPRYRINERAARVVTFYTAFNFFVGFFLAVGMGLSLSFLIFQILSLTGFLILYYLLKAKKFIKIIIFLSIVSLGASFSIFWFFMGGIYGPTLVSGLAIFYVVLNIAPTKWKYWTTIYVIVNIIFTFLFSYLFPDWIMPYTHTNQAYLHYGILMLQFFGYYIFIGISNQYCFSYERKAALQKNNELQIANEAKLRLFSIISHDLRGPVATFKGIINSVDEGFLTPQKLQRQLQYLKTMAPPLSTTLNNLLLWSRNQLEGLHASPELFCADSIIEEEVLLAASDAKVKSVIIENQVPTDVFVYADINQVRIILRNLIFNGIRYADNDSTVIIAAQKGDKTITFSVINKGIPIVVSSAEEFNRTGELKIDDLLRNQKYNGLGLQLCYDFTKINNGKIWIDTTVKDKTVFLFSLPSTN